MEHGGGVFAAGAPGCFNLLNLANVRCLTDSDLDVSATASDPESDTGKNDNENRAETRFFDCLPPARSNFFRSIESTRTAA